MRTVLLAFLAFALHAQQRAGNPYPPVLEGAKEEVYKRAGDVTLKLWIFSPANHNANAKKPAIVFFFGGGWTGGSPGQFQQHAKMLAERGMVAITADYRVASRHQVKVADCIRDAKSAIRYVRANAARLGIDPNRIAAGGGSAGGHLAAATGVVEGFDEPKEDSKVNSRPNALVLFNPALVLAESVEAGIDAAAEQKLAPRFGAAPREVSPFHQMKKRPPPTIIFHGKADTTVPYRTAEAFVARCEALGGKCELAGYDGQQHGFFNHGRGGNEYYEKTTARMIEFLQSSGYLK
ncbi:MAG: alpha/beta hydrolase fold domain-containing protein [Bryobacterales bacterium]|nr:alpha/beta hydrolase fold domain-containing protein [Bryobacterales bacterium]